MAGLVFFDSFFGRQPFWAVDFFFFEKHFPLCLNLAE